MDGWYVKQLLLHSDSIRSNLPRIVYSGYRGQLLYDTSDGELPVDFDFDDSTYDDLLDVESMFRKLNDSGLLTSKEFLITNLIMNGEAISDISKKYNMARITVFQIFSGVCSKIAFNLGGRFTNEGFINNICRKNYLLEEHVAELRRIMEI